MGAVDGWLKQRYEIKYVLAHETLPRLLARLSQYMRPDPNTSRGNNGYFNHSIYFDSPRLRFYLEKNEGLLERTKPRLRAYRDGPNRPPSAYFLELKNRHDRLVYKERVEVSRELALRLLRPSALEFGAEIGRSETLCKFYYLSKRFALQPQVAVLYNRLAYVSDLYPNLRITLDTRLQSSQTATLDGPPSGFRYALPLNRMILEIKYDKAIPRIILREIEAFGLQQVTFSKFATCMEINAPGQFNVLRSYFD